MEEEEEEEDPERCSGWLDVACASEWATATADLS